MGCKCHMIGRKRIGQTNGGSKITGKDALYGGLALVALFVIANVFGKDKPPPPAPLPNAGSGIPQGWTPGPDARALYDAMKGAGTNETLIFSTLQGKTPDQLVAIYNEFNRLFFSEGNGDLFQWFQDDLSGDDLQRALGYFSGTGLRGIHYREMIATPIANSVNCVNNDIAAIAQCIQ